MTVAPLNNLSLPRTAAFYLLILVAAYGSVFFGNLSLQPSGFYPDGQYGWWNPQVFRAAANIFNVDLADPAYTLWPTNRLVGDLLKDGILPLWNPYQGAGEPLAAQFSTRVFFPYQALENLAPAILGDFFLLGRPFIAALLTYVFIRTIGCSWIGAFVAGLAYMFSGPFVWMLSVEPLSNAAMVFPLLILATHRTLATPGPKWALVQGISVALVLLAGQPETALYLVAVSGVYALFLGLRLDSSRIRNTALFRYAVGSLLGVGLASPLLMPFFEYLIHGFHFHPVGGDMGTRDSLSVGWAAGMLYPTLFSLPRPQVIAPVNGIWDHIGTYFGLVGPFVIFYFAPKISAVGRPTFYFFVAILLFMAMKHLGLAPFVWLGSLPLFDQAWSQRWASPVSAFGFAIALGWAMDAIGGDNPRKTNADRPDSHRQRSVWLFIAIAAIPVVATYLGYSGVPVLAPKFTTYLIVFGSLAMVPVLHFRWGEWGSGGTAGTRVSWITLAAILLMWFWLPEGWGDILAYKVMLLIAGAPVVAAASAALIFGPEALARHLNRFWPEYRVLGYVFVAVLIFLHALLQYPAIFDYQQAFIYPNVIFGGVVSIVATVITGFVVTRKSQSDQRIYFAIAALLAIEFIFVIPRGFDPAAAWQKIALFGILLVGLFLIFWLVLRLWQMIPVLVLAVISLFVLDLGAKNGLPERRDTFVPAPYVEFLKNTLADQYRATGGGGILLPTYASALGIRDVHFIDPVSVDWFHKFSQKHLMQAPSFVGTSLWFSGVPYKHVRDLDPARIQWYAQHSMKPTDATYYESVDRVLADWRSGIRGYSLLGVRYFVLPKWVPSSVVEPGNMLGGLGLRVVYDADVKILENPSALPRSYVVGGVDWAEDFETAQEMVTARSFDLANRAVVEDKSIQMALSGVNDAAGRAEIVSDRANSVTLRVDMSDRGLLVLNDTYYPGWTAEADGRELPIYRVNGLVRGVVLGPGSHTITFSYFPDSFFWGLMLALSATLMAVGWVAGAALRRFK